MHDSDSGGLPIWCSCCRTPLFLSWNFIKMQRQCLVRQHHFQQRVHVSLCSILMWTVVGYWRRQPPCAADFQCYRPGCRQLVWFTSHCQSTLSHKVFVDPCQLEATSQDSVVVSDLLSAYLVKYVDACHVTMVMLSILGLGIQMPHMANNGRSFLLFLMSVQLE